MLLHVSLPLLQLLGMDMYGLGTCAGNTVVLGAVCYTQGRLSLQLSVADAQINDFLNVSLTHTECRLTGGVCSLDTAGHRRWKCRRHRCSSSGWLPLCWRTLR